MNAKTCIPKQDCGIVSERSMNIKFSGEILDLEHVIFNLKNPVHLTNRAWEKILQYTQEKLRLTVVKKGCAGMGYAWMAEDKPLSEHDIKINNEIDLNLYFIIDRRIVFYIMGLYIDYQSIPIYSKFIFFNKNNKNTCGCGSSFR